MSATIFLTMSVGAQSRKYMSNFQFFQSYLNPAMTGFEGTRVNASYRNSQWVGFEGAPKTYMLSADFNSSSGHSYGISLLQDSFGPYKENQVFLNYGYAIQLSRTLQLRAGAAATIDMLRLDQSALQLVAQNDPLYQSFVNDFNKSMVIDFNAGMALTGNHFYLGYSLQNASRGALAGKQDFFNTAENFHHVGQAGVRLPLSKTLGIVVNGLYRYDPSSLRSIEGQVKTVFYNTAWIGVGYRSDMAYVGSVGFCVNQARIGFSYELPSNTNKTINSKTSELVVSYKFNSRLRQSYGNYKKPSRKTLNVW
jgi:type IX secretion system PorP/SprF family membrane protein